MVEGDPSLLEWRGDMGFYPARPSGVYMGDYFEKYARYAATPMGQALNRARVELVQKYAPCLVPTDIGIGCGQFVESVGGLGWDVNPYGVKWLVERGRFVDPYRSDRMCVTFWDALEHLEDPDPLLRRCKRFVFAAIPVFRDRDHVLASKHFRPDEHYLYFTRHGFARFMAERGFRLLEVNERESELGREEIASFAFRRE